MCYRMFEAAIKYRSNLSMKGEDEMAGLRGQTGASTNLERPRTKKQKQDREKYIIQNGIKRVKTIIYFCSICNSKTENPNKTNEGKPYCTSCVVNRSEVVILKAVKTKKIIAPLPIAKTNKNNKMISRKNKNKKKKY